MNTDLRNYDFVEGTEFTALMPKVLEQAPGTVGLPESAVTVPYMGMKVNGNEPMEVVDVEKFFEGEGGNEGGEGGNTDEP